ncbi:YheC/YheD family protein [Rummeliibacillus sp. NPDC094406]|uniref:YheC/YheD family protein n=1 Tax=Rummeliibacillus sp. NPDC094406 TaxID=3364511 RepID=UPI0038200DE1
MKSSRGRINQYKILFADEKLRKHLVKTELLSEQSLTTMLNEREPIVVKSVYGTEEISIFQKNNQYHIKTNSKISSVIDKEALYTALKKETTQQYYIIQKSPTTHQLFRQFVTMQRNTPSSEWYLASQTKKIRSTLATFVSAFFYKKIQEIAICASTKLGESFSDCHTIVLDIACDLYGDIWIFDSVLHLSNSKWSQYHELRRNRKLPKYLPNTELLTPETFRLYLQRYKSIILKPCVGQNGIGVIQIRSKSDSTYEIHTDTRKIIQPSMKRAFKYIKKNLLTKNEYIVQQRIALATINKSLIDIRVVLQKTDGIWKITGKLVKVAGKQFIITNAAKKLLTLEKALYDAKMTRVDIKKIEYRLNKICKIATDLLVENNAGLNIIGFDIGITKKGELWIFEGNKVPDIQMFNDLEDKTMYKTILNIRNTSK